MFGAGWYPSAPGAPEIRLDVINPLGRASGSWGRHRIGSGAAPNTCGPAAAVHSCFSLLCPEAGAVLGHLT